MTMSTHRRATAPRHFPPALAERGFSLMEGMTVIGIMAIILMMVTQIFAVTYDVFVKQSARSENETGATLAARTISDMTRGASQVVDSQVINGTTYASGTDVLVLKMPAIDSSNAVIAAAYDYVAIYRDGTETTKIFSDTDAASGSKRVDGKKLVTARNQTMKFRYNNPVLTDATRVQAYLVNQQTVRGTTVITTKGWTSIFLRNAE
jgi:type II secretory pathway component PulJ